MPQFWSYYPVEAMSFEEVVAKIYKMAIPGRNAERIFSGTVGSFGGRFDFSKDRGSCRVTQASISVNDVIIFPRWVNIASLDGMTQVNWATMVRIYKGHEFEHVAIDQQTGAEVYRTLMGFNGYTSCDDLKDAPKNTVHHLYGQIT